MTDQPPAPGPLPPTARADTTAAADGVPVATYTWLPGDGSPHGWVQIAHGAAEHARRYDRFARRLNAEGWAVIASDHRGHGATAEHTGGLGISATPAWGATVEDLHAVGERARGEQPGLPFVLFGHSMGSQLARDYAQEHGGALDGLILSGTFRSLPGCEPATALAQLSEEVERGGRAAASEFVPDLFAAFNDPLPFRTGYEWLSRDAAEVDAYAADPWCGFPFSAGLALDWVTGSRKINDPVHLARVPRSLPVHVVVGDQDPCNAGMTLVYELLEDFRYLGLSDLSWRAWPGARHEVLNETNREEVTAGLLAWLGRLRG
ncbi:alpha/beta fold hydrolase [Streptomyces sp. DSM 44917]|uniref:Alpha/beta fold hydrolase n=1 Tax=Streptomyces boetiae TaxID=3075541 RepID=A0ABU2L4P1_9ACTN|nr:alpha/beta fold hydrolase [Streptomyces sp. DSM 44917]MDT0306526.1 alpha/beta fold hydrolase [Streptomyces sp. DSM 44917]